MKTRIALFLAALGALFGAGYWVAWRRGRLVEAEAAAAAGRLKP